MSRPPCVVIRPFLAVSLVAVVLSGAVAQSPEASQVAPVVPPSVAAAGAAGPAGTRTGFRDIIRDTGITWQHHGVRPEIETRFNLYDHGSAVAVADIDADGLDDIYLLSEVGGNALYRNKGGHRFEDITAKAGVGLAGKVCVAAAFGDYDNDGYPDLFVATTRGGNVLFHNNKNGTFTNVTKKAGLTYVGHSCAALWFDYDNDGYLDLFVGNTGQYTTEEYDQVNQYFLGTPLDILGWLSKPRERALLYHNNRDGTFTEVGEKAGIGGQGWISDVTACDFDGDGLVDLYVTRMFGENILYRNKGDGTFEDVTHRVLGKTPVGAMGARWVDADNDGRMDLYVVDMHSDMWMIPGQPHPPIEESKRYDGPFGPVAVTPEQLAAIKKAYGYQEALFGNAFYHQKSDGTFEEISQRAGLENFWPWAIAAGDFDCDGFVDFFIAAGMGYPFEYWPNYLLMNQGDLTWVNKASELGVEPRLGGQTYPLRGHEDKATRSSRTAATADFAHDGRLDLIVNNFNHEPSFLANEFAPQSWLEIKLVGKKVNRDAVGARVVVRAGKNLYTRIVDGSGGYLAQSSHTLHFGLGKLTAVDEITVYWPGKKVQHVPVGPLNRLMTVEES